MENKFKKIVWTQHSLIKMKQYGLSKIKILNLLHKPERTEDGIVVGTVAMMRTNSAKNFNNKKLSLGFKKWAKPQKAPGEIWLMYKDIKDQRKIISCWRYPGITKPGEQVLIPADIKLYLQTSKEFN